MRCVSFCTAEKYQLYRIAYDFKACGHFTKMDQNVLHIYKPGVNREFFVFAFGCVVMWGFTRSQEQNLIEDLKYACVNPLLEIEVDHFSYRIGERTQILSHQRLNADIIELEDDDSQIKLAISYGLAQSVKLEAYEESVIKTVHKNETLPKELARTGKIPLSGKAISKRLGEIFIERSSVNLSSEYLDMPEYFWLHPNLEEYYLLVEKYLDIPGRVTSLNQRLDVLHELFEMMTTQLQHRHSSILEIIIIVLIVLEVVFSVVHFNIILW